MKAHTAVHLYLGVEQLGYLGHVSCLGREPRLSTARGTLGHLRGLRHGEPAKSLKAVVKGLPNPSPSFTTTQVSEISNHDGAICTIGSGCTTGGDRELLDFLSVTVGLHGEANVVWADAVNQNVADGTTTAASTNLVIQSTSVTMPDSKHYRFSITGQDLSTLAASATLGGTDAVWLVRWEVPDPYGAGHTYFAAMESDGGAAPSFFDGETSSINTTHGKFLTYPPAHTIQASYLATSPGTITLTVPVADV